MTDEERAEFFRSISQEEAKALLYAWPFWARENQLEPPGDWAIWVIQAGRGFGKTRIGAEWVREHVESGKARRIALVAATAGDARDTMVEGESGILAISRPDFMPHYEPSKRRVTWPNGARATLFSADAPSRLRGPQHDLAWADELAAWKALEKTWDNLMFGLRLGQNPRCVVTTTPQPRKVMMELVKEPGTVVTRGSTYDNLGNLAPTFRDKILRKYEGTTLGRQELLGELLEDIPGALWTRPLIEAARVKEAPEMARIVVALDPAATSGEDADETGIVVVGKGRDGQAYVLRDESGHYTPGQWAKVAIALYHEHRADRVIGEVNNGGEMIEHTLRTEDKAVSYRSVHATRGKTIRAEPIVALYEQEKVHHVGGFADMEDQMCSWTPSSDISPDRMDALVWGLTELMLDEQDPAPLVVPVGIGGQSRWR